MSVVKDASRKAYIVNLDTNTILNEASKASANIQEVTNCVGLSSDEVFADKDAIKYEGWLAGEHECSTTIDWHTHTKSTNDAATQKEYTALTLTRETYSFFLDTRATVHILLVSTNFTSLRPISSWTVKGMGGSSISASGIGDVRLQIEKKTYIVLKGVLYIPQAAVCLISISQMSNDSQITLHFDSQTCWLTDEKTSTIIAKGVLTSQNLYALNLFESQTEVALITTMQPTIEMWHQGLSHANYQAISDMSKKGMVSGMSFHPSTMPPKCQSCASGKQTQTPVPKAWQEGQRATKRLEIVWVDLSRPHDVTSCRGNRYILNLMDDATSFLVNSHSLERCCLPRTQNVGTCIEA